MEFLEEINLPAIDMTPPLVISIVCATLFVGFVIYAIVKGQRQKPSVGAEEMISKEAIAQTALDPTGTVLIEGELWTAIAEGSRIEPGEEVIVTNMEGLKLRVKKKSLAKGEGE